MTNNNDDAPRYPNGSPVHRCPGCGTAHGLAADDLCYACWKKTTTDPAAAAAPRSQPADPDPFTDKPRCGRCRTTVGVTVADHTCVNCQRDQNRKTTGTLPH